MNATIEQMAQDKLAAIIQREGDADGERLKPYYLEALRSEIELGLYFSDFTIKQSRRRKNA